MSERGLYMVFTNVVDDQHDEFNRWYNEEHVPDVLAVEGFDAARRYRLHPTQRPGQEPPTWEYLTIYEVSGDLEQIHEEVAKYRRTRTSAVDYEGHRAWVFVPLTERATAGDIERPA